VRDFSLFSITSCYLHEHMFIAHFPWLAFFMVPMSLLILVIAVFAVCVCVCVWCAPHVRPRTNGSKFGSILLTNLWEESGHSVDLELFLCFLLKKNQLVALISQDQGGTAVPSWSCSQAVSKPVWHIPLLCVQWKTPDDGLRNCPKHVLLQK